MSNESEHGAWNAVEEAFARLGIPLTLQRRRVWDYFWSCGRAITIAEAAEALAPGGTAQATVYRTVNLLIEMGLLVSVHTGLPDACYTAIGVGHSHPLVCRSCRRIVQFDGEGDLTLLERYLKVATGFSIYGHHLEVYGICPDCAQATAEAGSDDVDAEAEAGV